MLRQSLNRCFHLKPSSSSVLSIQKLYSTSPQHPQQNNSSENSTLSPKKSFHEKLQQYELYWYTIGLARLFWKRIQENKWRWNHVLKDINPIIPYPKDLQPSKLSLRVIWERIIIQSFKDYISTWKEGLDKVYSRKINDIRRITKKNPKFKEYQFFPDKYLQDPDDEEELSVQKSTTQLSTENQQIVHSVAKESGKAAHGLQDNWKQLTQNNFLLLRNCLNQFIIGYHEGMGRDITQMQNFDVSREGISKQLNREKWLDTVSKAAQTIKEAREEVTKMVNITDEELQKGNLKDEVKSK